MEICLASNNQHKIEELKQLLGNEFIFKTLSDIGCFEDIEETGITFEENSKIKSDFVFEKFGINCISDDSGLEIDALEGRPGVFSARYSGVHGNHEANIAKVLTEMKNLENRSARFRTVISLNLDGETTQFEGSVEGKINYEPIGTDGFGYDPIFIPQGFDTTFAQMNSIQKNQISHRAVAIKKLVAYLKQKK
ncbi:MAG: RdgB/HAM1 family non-canonical purine NTP pyrophosphatase [Bacteroidetes bacterium]|nr:RdgB/HAM1 family non-canonical purine NTP pyrophosphatase [Bacteroidota bacterium]